MSTMKDQRRPSTDLEVEGPFGTKIKFYGKEVSALLLVAAIAAGGVYLILQHDSKASESMSKIQANQEALTQHMDEMIYVMSLSEKDREKLHISMPESLRAKTTRRD